MPITCVGWGEPSRVVVLTHELAVEHIQRAGIGGGVKRRGSARTVATDGVASATETVPFGGKSNVTDRSASARESSAGRRTIRRCDPAGRTAPEEGRR
jgi:hypothetical protein